MKVMLFFPPNWTPTMPHLALPTLTAFLRRAGVEVIQRDLNAEVFAHVLTRRYLRGSLDRVRRLAATPRGVRHTSPPPERVQWALREGPRLVSEVEAAVRTIRSPAFFEGPVGRRAFLTVAESLELASLPFYPADLHLQSYQAAVPVDESRALLRGVQDPQTNMFLEIYRDLALDDIRREQPDVVGISIPSMPQMLPGMTLAYLVKQAGLRSHVTVGGPHISMLREALVQTPALFDLIDSAVAFDGETPLLELAAAVASGQGLAQVPNLIWRDGDQVRTNALLHEREKIAALPLPDFDGLRLDQYLAPDLVLPLLTARGCYFGKCTFCNTGYGEPGSFSQQRAEQVIDQMQALHDRYGVRKIFFSDEAISPRNLKRLSARLAEMGSPFDWGGCARFEKVVSQELLQSMQAGGCRMILFGLESASTGVIQLMDKGTELEHMSRILRQSAEAGIWNHTFFFFGFPGETLADAQQTVNFLYAHKAYIHSAALGTFLMERYSPAHRFPESFGVRVIEDPAKDLAIYFDYEVDKGMDDRMAELVESRFLDTLPDKPHPQFYVSDVYRFLYACHLSERGLPCPPWLAVETAAA